MVDRIFYQFSIIGKDPGINLRKVVVDNVLIALDNNAAVNVGLCASINVSEGLGGTVNDEIQQIAFFLHWCSRHICRELLEFLYHICLEVREAATYDSQQVERGRSSCLNVVVFKVVVEEGLGLVLEQFDSGFAELEVWHD